MIHLLLVIIYISFISLGLPDALLGSAWPRMFGELDVPVSYAGIVAMIISGSTIISSLQSGRMIKRFGTGLVTVVSVGLTAIALLGFSFSGNFLMLCAFAIPYGLGAGSVDAGLNNFVALHYKARHMSWLHCFWGLGATLGPYIMGLCLTGNLGWHAGYQFISYLQIALTATLIISLPLWKKQETAVTEDDSQVTVEKSNKHLSVKGALPVLIAFFCYCSLESVTGLWGSSYMVFKKGIEPGIAASFISLFYFGITGGRFLSGFLTVKLNSRAMIRLGQGAVLAGIILLIFSANTVMMCAGFVFIGLGCAPIFPALLHQTPERFGKTASQEMMGFQMACAYVGSMLSPPLAGFLLEKIGVSLYPFFLLFFAICLIAMAEIANKAKTAS